MKLVNLPAPSALKRHWQSLAMLDAILSPEWEYRYFSFDASWAKDEQLGSMRNGQGSAMRCLFTDSGAVLSGFDIEQKKSAFALKPGDLPKALEAFATEPAFDNLHTSFCLYREKSASDWTMVASSPKSHQDKLLELLAMDVNGYAEWALGYYESVVPLDAVQHIFAMEPLTMELVHSINVDATQQDVRKEAKEIGYTVFTATA